MTTIYKNAGKVLFTDPDDAYNPEEVRAHYSQFDKSLLQATYTVIPANEEGDERVIEFAKKTGTKGATPGSLNELFVGLAALVTAAESVAGRLYDDGGYCVLCGIRSDPDLKPDHRIHEIGCPALGLLAALKEVDRVQV